MDHPDLKNTFGAAFIGAMITMALYGLTTLQTYFYYTSYGEDGPGLKALVGFVWALDTAHAVMVAHAMYYYLILNYSNSPALAAGTIPLYTSVLINLVLSGIIQGYFTKRIFILAPKKHRWWLTSVITFLVIMHIVFGFVTIVALYIKRLFSRLHELTLYGATPFAVFAVLGDIAIAASLCALLSSRRGSFRSTNMLVNNLIIYAINRCLLTSIAAVVEVIVFAAMPHSFWFLAVDFVIGKLWVNSFLASLNTRNALRATSAGSNSNEVNLTGIRWGSRSDGTGTTDNSTGSKPGGQNAHDLSVHIAKESVSDGRFKNASERDRASPRPKTGLTFV